MNGLPPRILSMLRSLPGTDLFETQTTALKNLLDIFSNAGHFTKYSSVLYITRLLQLAYRANPTATSKLITEYQSKCSIEDSKFLVILSQIARMRVGLDANALSTPTTSEFETKKEAENTSKEMDEIVRKLNNLQHPYADFTRAVLLVEKGELQQAANIYLNILNIPPQEDEELKRRQGLAYFNLASLLYRYQGKFELSAEEGSIIKGLVEESERECKERLHFIDRTKVTTNLSDSAAYESFVFNMMYSDNPLCKELPFNAEDIELKNALVRGLQDLHEKEIITSGIFSEIKDKINQPSKLRDMSFTQKQRNIIYDAWQNIAAKNLVEIFIPTSTGILVRRLLEESVKCNSPEGLQLLASFHDSRKGYQPGSIIKDPKKATILATEARSKLPDKLVDMGPGSIFERLGPTRISAAKRILKKLNVFGKDLAGDCSKKEFEMLAAYINRTLQGCLGEEAIFAQIEDITTLSEEEMNITNATTLVLNTLAVMLNPSVTLEEGVARIEIPIKTRKYLSNIKNIENERELQNEVKRHLENFIEQQSIDSAIDYGHSGAMLHRAHKLLERPTVENQRKAGSLLHQSIMLRNPHALYFCVEICRFHKREYSEAIKPMWTEAELKEVEAHLERLGHPIKLTVLTIQQKLEEVIKRRYEDGDLTHSREKDVALRIIELHKTIESNTVNTDCPKGILYQKIAYCLAKTTTPLDLKKIATLVKSEFNLAITEEETCLYEVETFLALVSFMSNPSKKAYRKSLVVTEEKLNTVVAGILNQPNNFSIRNHPRRAVAATVLCFARSLQKQPLAHEDLYSASYDLVGSPKRLSIFYPKLSRSHLVEIKCAIARAHPEFNPDIAFDDDGMVYLKLDINYFLHTTLPEITTEVANTITEELEKLVRLEKLYYPEKMDIFKFWLEQQLKQCNLPLLTPPQLILNHIKFLNKNNALNISNPSTQTSFRLIDNLPRILSITFEACSVEQLTNISAILNQQYPMLNATLCDEDGIAYDASNPQLEKKLYLNMRLDDFKKIVLPSILLQSRKEREEKQREERERQKREEQEWQKERDKRMQARQDAQAEEDQLRWQQREAWNKTQQGLTFFTPSAEDDDVLAEDDVALAVRKLLQCTDVIEKILNEESEIKVYIHLKHREELNRLLHVSSLLPSDCMFWLESEQPIIVIKNPEANQAKLRGLLSWVGIINNKQHSKELEESKQQKPNDASNKTLQTLLQINNTEGEAVVARAEYTEQPMQQYKIIFKNQNEKQLLMDHIKKQKNSLLLGKVIVNDSNSITIQCNKPIIMSLFIAQMKLCYKTKKSPVLRM